MGKSKPQKATSQVVTSEPAKFVAPYITEAANQASNIFGKGIKPYYPNQSYVPYSAETEQALTGQAQRALSGNPAVKAAQDQQLATIRGDYLTGSPALEQELMNVQGGIASRFAGGGGYRSSANQQVLGRESSNAVLRNYQNERALQQQASIASPNLAAQDYIDLNALAEVGGRREDMSQLKLQDEMDRYYYDQTAQNKLLDQYISRLTQLGGGYSTQTTTSPTAGRSPIQGVMSGLQAGLGAAGALSSAGLISATGPIGIGLAGLGALTGLFG